jgi:hypothetical protein
VLTFPQAEAGVRVGHAMRIWIIVLAALLGSCARCPRPAVGLGAPRVADQASGLPKTYADVSNALLDMSQTRRCQVLFEPAFENPHAVWFVLDDARGDATVFVRLFVNHEVQSFSTSLDRGTALRLSRSCLTALTSDFPSCQRWGHDGAWYHAAHPRAAGSYAMASFWTPGPGTVANAFVKVAEALRNYATLPQPLGRQAWLTLQEAEREFSKRLADPRAG